MNLQKRMSDDQRLVDEALARWLPPTTDAPALVREAMRYSVFAGGKRFRPILLLEACRVVGGEVTRALPAAAALEMIHTYSLIHDDLPCMDNAALRRGQPTCHKKFGDAVAVLAGDALLTQAFFVLSRQPTRVGVTATTATEVIGLIAEAAGAAGMVGGQVLDILHTGTKTEASRPRGGRAASDAHSIGPEQLFDIHHRKTGALIQVAAEAGAAIGDAAEKQRSALRNYGEQIGLAFQITDDLLDVNGNVESLGKDVAGDAEQEKITFPSVFGVAKSKEMADAALAAALEALNGFAEEADWLRELARFVVRREH